MKNIFFIGLLVSSAAFSQITTLQNAPSTLAGVMKSMSMTLKKIALQANDATKNAESEKLAQDLLDMSKNSSQHTPDTIAGLPKDQLAIKQQEYLKMVDDMISLQQELVAAFHNNDNAKAADMLNKLMTAKKEGHNAFK